MSLPTFAGIPASFNSGDTVLFTEQFADYPNSTWTAKLWLNLNGTAAPVVTATNSGDNFLFTLANTVTAALSPGAYEYSIVTTISTTSTATPKWGTLSVLPNFATNQTPSFAQAMVTLLQTVLQTFAATDKTSVSFNGQSFSRANIGDYRNQLVFFQAQVIAEKAALDALRGNPTKHLVGTRFAPAAVAPWGGFGWPYNRQ